MVVHVIVFLSVVVFCMSRYMFGMTTRFDCDVRGVEEGELAEQGEASSLLRWAASEVADELCSCMHECMGGHSVSKLTQVQRRTTTDLPSRVSSTLLHSLLAPHRYQTMALNSVKCISILLDLL